jgi:hypothetical protein
MSVRHGLSLQNQNFLGMIGSNCMLTVTIAASEDISVLIAQITLRRSTQGRYSVLTVLIGISCALPIAVPPPACRQPFLMNPKVKAFLSAFNALFTDDDNNDGTAVDVDNDSGLQDCDEQEADDAVDVDVYNFLVKIGSLKD